MAAATSTHPEWAARAAFDLAGIYADGGDAEQAEHWWRVVFESGDPTLRL